jgi:glycosyltransferase involved in cell wall biosynthesis
MNISLCFTSYKTAKYIIKQLSLDHLKASNGLIDEVVIQDDASGDFEILRNFASEEVRVFTNGVNLSPLENRPVAISKCKNEWVLMMDADNFLFEDSYGAVRELVASGLDPDIIYAPSRALPRFDYSEFCGKHINGFFVRNNIDSIPNLRVFLNTGNYFVNKDSYLAVSRSIDPTFSRCVADTVYFNYLWLSSGRIIQCVPGYAYHHTVRPDSYWATDGRDSAHLLERVYKLFRSLG